MEVNANSFPHHLLGVLIAISEADFVSFDLELSGIPNRMQGRPRRQGRQTLEDRYLEAKAGAERHQILQVGFTCARFDYIENKYVLRPYNVNISPLVDERLDLEREFSFQSGAIAFLLKNGFNFNLPFAEGVQYLSRDEAEVVKQIAYDRIDKKNIFEDMQLKPTDVDSLDFLRRVRESIANWKESKTLMSLSITTHTGLENAPEVAAISRFEKRLVHQLLRAEYPELVGIGRTDSIKIIDYDELREEDNKKRQKTRVKEQIVRQTGFRWVIEALARGNVEPIDPSYFAKDLTGMAIALDYDAIKSKLRNAALRIRDQQPVLVGHNMFTDLVYLYRTFIGALPDTLDKFCDAIHQLFPRIVDTKYLATHDGGDLNASPTLEEIAEGLSTQPLPRIVTHPDHRKYHDNKAFHEAGYDSLLTATIMLRLATKLDSDGKISSSSESSYKTAVETQDALSSTEEMSAKDSTNAVATSPSNTLVQRLGSLEVQQSKTKKKKQKQKQKLSRFACTNAFEALETQNTEPTEPASDSSNPDPQPQETTWESATVGYDGSKEEFPIDAIQWQPLEILPAFNSNFWDKYGNRLRVFGTEESVLEIASWEEFPSAYR